jgi:hypothetical protein
MASIGLGIISLVMFLWAVYQSAYNSTDREIIIGLIELLAILFAIVGLTFGLIGETREDKYKRTAHIGIVLNIIVGILHIIVLSNAY